MRLLKSILIGILATLAIPAAAEAQKQPGRLFCGWAAAIRRWVARAARPSFAREQRTMFRMGGIGRQTLFAPFFGALAALALLPSPVPAQSCNPSSIFATPILYSPADCPLVLDYLVQDNRANAPTVAVADFNRDGNLDVVVAGWGSVSYELAVQLGTGDGTFQDPNYIYPGTCCSPDYRGASWAIVGDFNGDGNPDIAAGTPGGYVTILLGNGAGTFSMSQALTVTGCCTGPAAAAVGDFNGDGKLDLVVIDGTTSPGTAILYLGNGDGTFQSNPVTITVGDSGNHPDSITVGDFNGNGKLDFATANYSSYNFGSNVSVVLGNGNGTFQTAVNYSTGNQPLNNGGNGADSIVAADFNNDGHLDLATLDIGNGQVAVFLNNGNGTLQNPSYFTAGFTFNNTQHPTQLAVGDFDKDGNADLVLIANQQSAAGVLLGNGNGTFQPAAWYVTDNDGTGVAVGDLNGDGNPDFLVSATNSNTLTIALGNGDGTFKGARNYVPYIVSNGFSGNVPNPTSVAFGDFNGDGKPDMAVVGQGNSFVTIFINNGDGTYTESANYSSGSSASVNMVAATDLNHDGKLDLVVGLNTGGPPSSFSVLLGNGDGSFQSPVTYANGSNGGVLALALADVNGDGELDLISNAVRTDTNKFLYVNLSNGNGTFQPGIAATPQLCPGGGGGGADYFTVADVNGDGKPDIAAACGANLHQTTISILLGNGDGTFGAPTQFSSGETPVSIAVGDFNEDGKVDLAVANNWPTPAVSILLGNGNGSFQSPVAYSVFSSAFWQAYEQQLGTPADTFPNYVVAEDFDGDGHLDLLVGEGAANMHVCCPNYAEIYYNNGVQLFLGNGNGTFEPEQSFLAGRQGTFLAVADVNADGLPDAAVVDSQDSAVTILINESKPVADLAISKTDSPDPVIVGNNLTYTITVANGGPGPATDVTMTDTLPPTVNFVSATPSQGSCSGTTTVSCNLGSLANGGAATVSIVVTPTQAGGISNTASVAANVIDPNLNNNLATQDTTIHPVPPDTAITTHPATLTNSTSATFEFTATATGTFECNLDGGGFAVCTTPKSYNGLAAGAHTFQVRAVDVYNDADPTPASFNWTIDTTAPDTVIDGGPANPTNSTSASFTFHATEAGSSFACQLDSGGFSACTSGQNYTGLAVGAHTFEVKATDGAGNTDPTPASFNWTIIAAPDTIINSGPTAASGGATNSTSAIFDFSSTDPSATFACSLDGGAFAACTSPKSYTKLKVGTHNFKVQATAGGLTDPTPASFDWTIDNKAPNTAITSGPPVLTNNSVATFTFTSTEAGGSFQCSLDGGAFTSCTSPFVSGPLADGKHAFQVKAVDAAGNLDKSAAKAKAWTVDTIRPITTITGKPTDPTTSTSVAFKFTSEKKSTFQCSLDGGAFTLCKSGQKYSGLAIGSHTFQVQATDAAGNVELTPASYSWTQN